MHSLVRHALTVLIPGLASLLAWAMMPPPPSTTPEVAVAASPAVPPRRSDPPQLRTLRPAGDAGTWRRHQVMLAPARDVELEEIAADHEASVIRAPGVSGYGVLELPEDSSLQGALEALRADPRVRSVTRHGRTRASGSRGAPAEPGYWHIDALSLPGRDLPPGQVVVALADTGASLPGIDVVAPWDFVDDDAEPADEHGHGTHLASLIAGRDGAAPGASLMPLRVLDESGDGLEYDLIEAIWWAADSGADVLTLGLTLGPDYTPSAPLLEALDAARAAGLVVVAAAGNRGEPQPRWPAASTAVLAVGAACPGPEGLALAPYSNRGLSLVAPGGCLDRDGNRDGIPDGIPALTLDPEAPGTLGVWMYEGTSQAAALVAAAAARLLASGARVEDVPVLLHHTAAPLAEGSYAEGLGAGIPDVRAAIRLGETLPPEGYAPRDAYHVSLMPFLRGGGGLVTPSARLVTLDTELAPARDVVIYGHVLSGGRTRPFSCRPAADGVCVVSGLPVPAGSPRIWSFQVERVLLGGSVPFAPGGLLFATEALEEATRQALGSAELRSAVPALRWDEAESSTLGPLAPAYAVVDMATGAAAPVTGLLLAPALIEQGEAAQPTSIPGAALRHLQVDALGDRGDPFTHVDAELLVFDAMGAGGGLSAGALLSPPPRRRAACESCRFDGQPILLSQGRIAGVDDPTGTAIQAALDEGGWLLGRLGGATALLARTLAGQ